MTVQELIEQLFLCDLDAQVEVLHTHYDGSSDVTNSDYPAVVAGPWGVILCSGFSCFDVNYARQVVGLPDGYTIPPLPAKGAK